MRRYQDRDKMPFYVIKKLSATSQQEKRMHRSKKNFWTKQGIINDNTIISPDTI